MQPSTLIAWLVLAVAPAASGAEARETVRETVRCHEIAFSRALERRDLDAFLALVHPEARFVGAEIQRGPAEVAAAWRRYFEAEGPLLAWRPELVEVVDDGSLALTRGPYRLRQRDAEGTWKESWGTFTSVWRRGEGGRWQVLFDAGGTAPREPSDALRDLFTAPSGCPDAG